MKEKREKRGLSKRTRGLTSGISKALGVGFGITGLSAMLGSNRSQVLRRRRKDVFVITHGGDDPNRAILSLLDDANGC